MTNRTVGKWLKTQLEGVLETAEWSQKYDEAVLKGDWKAAHDLVADSLKRVTKDVNLLRKRQSNSLKKLRTLEQKNRAPTDKATKRGR